MHTPKALLLSSAVTLSLLAGSAVAKDTEADAQLREALRQKVSELNEQPVAPATPAPAAATTMPALAQPATAAPAATAPGASTAPALLDDAETAKLREALRQRMEQEAANPTPIVEATPWPNATATKEAGSASPQAGFAPMTPPPLPISGTKQQRLQELLNQYQADLITPSEYHAQRAKIIAE